MCAIFFHLLAGMTLAVASIPVSPKVPLRLVNLLSQDSLPVPYADAWEFQKKLLDHHVACQDLGLGSDGVCGTVVALEHRSVYTLGTATKENSGPFTNRMADGSKLTYDLFSVERAGEATYHGPGQLVVYPILDLNYFDKDIDRYLRGIEETVIKSLECVGIQGAGRITGLTGVWVGDQKVAAIGIKLRRWVTMHGVSVNVCPDMRYFNNIVPCGIRDKGVGSVVSLRQNPMTVREFAAVFLEQFCKNFNAQFAVTLDETSAIEFLSQSTKKQPEMPEN